jgi:hypothetical protein
VLYSFYIRWQAEKCLAVMRGLNVGSTTKQEAHEALRAFHGFETDGTATIDRKDYPTYTYRFDNTGFHPLRLFHPTRFGMGLTFRDGVIIEKGAGFLQEPFHTANTQESLPGLLHNSSLEESTSGMIVGIYDPPVRMEVLLDTRASETSRKEAYEYNLACFTSLRGCESVYEILPNVKQKNAK